MAKARNRREETLESNSAAGASERSLFVKEDGKTRWFEPDTSSLTGQTAKYWGEYQSALEELNRCRAQFEGSFYATLQAACRNGKLNGFRALEVGINKGYAISYGYKWGKLSISFDPDKKYTASGMPSSSNKFTF